MAAPTQALSAEGTIILNQSNSTYAPLTTTQYEGRIRVATFTVTLAAQAAGLYTLCQLPKGAKIVRFEHLHEASLGASATISLGLAGKDNSGYISDSPSVADAPAFFRAAATDTTTTVQVVGVTAALGWQYSTQKEVLVTATVAVAALPASGTWSGQILYVVD
jgi:hypothetical protein